MGRILTENKFALNSQVDYRFSMRSMKWISMFWIVAAMVSSGGGVEALSSSQAADRPVFQVMSQDPHFLGLLQRFTQTVRKEGRLWLVTERSHSRTPKSIQKLLKEVSSESDQGGLRHFSYVPKIKDLQPVRKNTLQAFEGLNPERLKQNVQFLSAVSNRRVKMPENQQMTAWLQGYLERLGYQTSQICYATGACSVLAERKGTSEADKIILVEGHFDSVGALKAGADDNASGAAGVLELAHAVAATPMTKTVQFFLTNGEEQGLYGAEDYVSRLESSGQLGRIVLVINMDMIGYNSNGIVELETDPPYEALAKKFAERAARYTRLQTKITLGAWGSDHVPFLTKNVPAILTIEDWSTKTPCYHKVCDLPETVNWDYAIEILKMNLAAILEQ